MVEDMLGRMSGRTELTRYFNLCEEIDMENPIDISSFMSMLDDPIAGVVQYASPGDIENLCHGLIEGPFGDNYMRNLAILVRELYFGGCTDASYESFVDYMTITDITSESASSRSWFYQCCTEFSYWQTGTTSTSASDMVDLDYYHAWCADCYDIDADAADFQTEQTNVLYGGDEPRISNVFYANGSIDPWHAISNLHFDNPASPHVLMTGTSHCQDMYATADNDVAPLAATRDMQLQSMKAWVQEWVA
ncbi:peptidase S28 [Kipferlia bialata]|uniref:Peptidase S28 n=1 Tax=Kipferlia bialata TaxID=797122 RepID=A0A9K3CX42_9EUKA|nr:peptidase S28 [Kipferlia bialata]|eukprot:g6476.t1